MLAFVLIVVSLVIFVFWQIFTPNIKFFLFLLYPGTAHIVLAVNTQVLMYLTFFINRKMILFKAWTVCWWTSTKLHMSFVFVELELFYSSVLDQYEQTNTCPPWTLCGKMVDIIWLTHACVHTHTESSGIRLGHLIWSADLQFCFASAAGANRCPSCPLGQVDPLVRARPPFCQATSECSSPAGNDLLRCSWAGRYHPSTVAGLASL